MNRPLPGKDDLAQPGGDNPLGQVAYQGTHAEKQKIYGGIIKSTAILGVFRVFTVFLNFARYKVIAVTLGPVGVGIFGLFDVLVTTAVTVASLGVNVSAVRQIALTGANQDQAQLAATLSTVRILTQVLALAGGLAVVAFCGPISRVTFDTAGFETGVMIAALAVYFTTLVCGYRGQLQGLNRIRDLARISGLAAVTDTLMVTIPIILWGQPAIAPSLAASALVSAAIYWHTCRDPQLPRVKLNWTTFQATARPLITMGISIAAALLFSTLVIYATRVLINRDLGLTEAGLYFAAFALSGKAVGFLLDSMRTDFYPRLSAAAGDNARLNALINGQTEICLLLTVPGILATIAFAPYLLHLFLSASFTAGAPYLSLFALGSLARVISTPFDFVRLAKGRSLFYLLTGAGSAAVQIVLVYILLQWHGLAGAVLAYVLHAVGQAVMLVYTARHLTDFHWSQECGRLALMLIASSIGVFALSYFTQAPTTAAIGGVIVALIGFYNTRELTRRLGAEHRITKMLLRIPLIRKIVAQPSTAV